MSTVRPARYPARSRLTAGALVLCALAATHGCSVFDKDDLRFQESGGAAGNTSAGGIAGVTAQGGASSPARGGEAGAKTPEAGGNAGEPTFGPSATGGDPASDGGEGGDGSPGNPSGGSGGSARGGAPSGGSSTAIPCVIDASSLDGCALGP